MSEHWVTVTFLRPDLAKTELLGDLPLLDPEFTQRFADHMVAMALLEPLDGDLER